MNMKKAFLFTLCFVLCAFMLGGCSSGTDSADQSASGSAAKSGKSGVMMDRFTSIMQNDGYDRDNVKTVTFLDKKERRRCDMKPDYYGFVIPDHFVVGYGLDYAEYYRNLPYIGVLKPEVYSS